MEGSQQEEVRGQSEVNGFFHDDRAKIEASRQVELKLNVDASVFEGDHTFRISMVLKDDQEHFIQEKCMWFADKFSVLARSLIVGAKHAKAKNYYWKPLNPQR